MGSSWWTIHMIVFHLCAIRLQREACQTVWSHHMHVVLVIKHPQLLSMNQWRNVRMRCHLQTVSRQYFHCHDLHDLGLGLDLTVLVLCLEAKTMQKQWQIARCVIHGSLLYRSVLTQFVTPVYQHHDKPDSSTKRSQCHNDRQYLQVMDRSSSY